MDSQLKPTSFLSKIIHFPLNSIHYFRAPKPVDNSWTIAGQSVDNPPISRPDNNFSPKSPDFTDYEKISRKEIDLIINFNLSEITVTEGHKQCCVFCLQNIGKPLPIGKTYLRLKEAHGKSIKKTHIQQSKKILADNGFMQTNICEKTGGKQYTWYEPEEMAKQVQWVREGKPDLPQESPLETAEITLEFTEDSQPKIPRSKQLTNAIKKATQSIKVYYGFEETKIKKEWLINVGMITAATISVLNITPIITTAVEGTNAYYLLGAGGTWTLFYSIAASSVWMLKTHVPLTKAASLVLAATLLSLPLHAIINNNGGVIGYEMVDVLFYLGFPSDVVTWLYGSLFLATTIPLGNPFFHLAQTLKKLTRPFYTPVRYIPENDGTMAARREAEGSGGNDGGTMRPIELNDTARQRVLSLQNILDARELNKTGNMVSVVDLIEGLRTTVYIVQTSPRFDISLLEKQVKNMERSTGTKHINVIPSIEGEPNISHIEIPKSTKAKTIYLRDVINHPNNEFYNKPKTAIPLAQNIYGETEYRELIQFPHIIVAGTTGSGKSVEVNSMIISLMLKNNPNELQFIMIDPKMLELSIYESSVHLALPVVTKMDEAKSVLEMLVKEMEYRYALMADLKVRSIEAYNKKVTHKINRFHGEEIAEGILHPAPEKLNKLPLVVCIIDEMADLIMQLGKKMEKLIARIAQKARAAGIHLILATQRPDSEVVTGLIKANVPSRIALSVDSATNSRIILDSKGAEKLLGKGDMLIKTANSNKLIRGQGYFIDENEIPNYLKNIKENYS